MWCVDMLLLMMQDLTDGLWQYFFQVLVERLYKTKQESYMMNGRPGHASEGNFTRLHLYSLYLMGL